MANDHYGRLLAQTMAANVLTHARRHWNKYYSWLPPKQNELFSEVDRIYEETRLKYGEDFFKSYAKERRLNRRIFKENYSKICNYSKFEKLKRHTDENQNLPLLYYYEHCGKAIEYYQETGVTLSTRINEQRQQPGGNRLGGPLRYPHTIILWLKCNQDVLNNRLEQRIDRMLEEGLLPEIRAFYNEHNLKSCSGKIEFTKGILQSIGFKEFIPYLEQFNIYNDQEIEDYLRQHDYKMPTEEQFKLNEVSKEIKSLPAGLDVLNQCLNELKLVTIRYSKKQLKWINNRYLASRDRQVPVLYDLDTTNIEKWNDEIYTKAITIINAYCNNEPCQFKPLSKRIHPSAGLNEEITNICSICQRTFIGEYQWQLHLKSNKHKRRKESEKKKKEKLQKLSNNIL